MTRQLKRALCAETIELSDPRATVKLSRVNNGTFEAQTVLATTTAMGFVDKS